MVKTEKAKSFAFQYFHEGSWWIVELSATSLDDAQARINKLPLAQPLGEVVAKIPARAGFSVSVLCWIRNLLFAPRQAA